MPPPPGKIDIVKDGKTFTIDASKLDAAIDQGFHVESTDERNARAVVERNEEQHGGALGKVTAGLAGLERGVTLGLSDAYLASQGDYMRRTVEGAKAANPGLSTATEIVGAVAPSLLTGGAATPAGLASRAGAAIAKRGGAGIGRAIAGGAVEGAIFGAGTGVSELALSADPLTLENAVSVLSSRALFGAAVGGAAGGLGKLAEKGLVKAKGALDDYVARQSATSSAGVSDDLATIIESGDTAALKALRDGELATIKTTRAAESAKIVDDLRGYRDELIDRNVWIATKNAADREVREIGAMIGKADTRLRNALNNPKALADSPRSALAVLQQQEHALERLLAKADDIRAGVSKAPEESARLAALDGAMPALEQNRAFQERIRGILSDPASSRLDEIATAATALDARTAAAAEAKSSIGAQMLGGTVFGMASGIASGIPFIGGVLGSLVGARASKAATNLAFGRLGNAATGAAQRTSKAIDVFLGAAPAVQRATPVLATKVLEAVRYAPSADGKRERASSSSKDAKDAGGAREKLPALFAARSAELRSQVSYDETGTLRMRPEARERVASMLAGVRAEDPIAADRMETIAARRVEYLAGALPRRPDLPTAPGGKDLYRPSDMAMRSWARRAAAVEDPGGVEERLADGTLTPEDVEAYKAVYPERAAALTAMVMERLPELRARMPYKRRLALSMMTGVAVDPALDPQVFARLQASFAMEPGTEGGTQAPRPAPAFGSVKKSAPEPTPAQERAAS